MEDKIVEEISNIKDIVYIITALSGFVLGLLGFLKSINVDRRVRIEPYFRSVWSSITENIKSIIDSGESWAGDLERQLAIPNPDGFSNWGSVNTDLQLEEYEWDYDKKIHKLLLQYVSIIDKLSNTVDDYNDVRYLTTQTAKTAAGLRYIGVIKERRDEEKALLHLKRFNVSPEATFHELKSNTKYKKTLSLAISSIKKDAATLKCLSKKIRKRKSVYDFMFSGTGK